MRWPVKRAGYDGPDFLFDLQATIANTIAGFEPVVMLAAARHQRAIKKLVSGAVDLWDIPTDDLWCRDSGPSFVVDGKGGLAVTQFNFNGWGGKQAHGHDGNIAAAGAAKLGLPVFEAEFGDKAADAETAEILASLYPGREIVLLNIDAVGEVGGGIHCTTHEQPKL